MKAFIQSERGKSLYWLIGAIAVIDFSIFLVPPLFDLVLDRIDPFIMGMPYTVFMHLVLWIILAANLSALYWVQKVRGEL